MVETTRKRSQHVWSRKATNKSPVRLSFLTSIRISNQLTYSPPSLYSRIRNAYPSLSHPSPRASRDDWLHACKLWYECPFSKHLLAWSDVSVDNLLPERSQSQAPEKRLVTGRDDKVVNEIIRYTDDHITKRDNKTSMKSSDTPTTTWPSGTTRLSTKSSDTLTMRLWSEMMRSPSRVHEPDGVLGFAA